MVFALVSIALSAPPPTGFTTAVERVALERTSPAVESAVDPLMRTIRLTGAKIAGRLSSQLCPRQQPGRDGLTLHCTTRRLWAGIAQDEKGLYLDVRALRGVTWKWDVEGVPLQAWPMKALGIPDECPGASDAVKAECALGEGHLFEAEQLYSAALNGPDAHLARMRLGDLAMQRGDAEAAMGWYSKVVSAGPVTRIAQLRSCDLTGNCLLQKPAELRGLTGVIEVEAVVHLVRQALALNQDRRAMQLLDEAIERKVPVCQSARAFCQKALEAAFGADDDEATTHALAIFAATGIGEGSGGIDVSEAAAAAAEDAGAPGYAAAVLASLSGRMPREALDRHLQRVARLYLAAKDPVRAQFVIEYAEQKLTAAELRSQSWAQVRKGLTPRPAVAVSSKPRAPPIADRIPAMTTDVEISKELARAAQARATAAEPPPSPTPEKKP